MNDRSFPIEALGIVILAERKTTREASLRYGWVSDSYSRRKSMIQSQELKDCPRPEGETKAKTLFQPGLYPLDFFESGMSSFLLPISWSDEAPQDHSQLELSFVLNFYAGAHSTMKGGRPQWSAHLLPQTWSSRVKTPTRTSGLASSTRVFAETVKNRRSAISFSRLDES